MKRTIAVFFGGQSTEHDISIVTALSSVIRPLRLIGEYEVIPVYIGRDGRWFSDHQLTDIKTFSSAKIEQYLKTTKPVRIEIGGGLRLVKPGGLKEKIINIDVAFPAMHGTYGEDGSLMGLLRMSGIPFVGCDQAASVVAMDKVLSKQVASANGIDVTRSVHFSSSEFAANPTAVIERAKVLKLPLFVKPAHLGSSIGITKVGDYSELEHAIEVAAHYDDLVLVEEAVENLIEVTVPIIGNEQPETALVEAPLSHGDDFFDFETKYIREGGKKSGGGKSAQGYSQLPAELPGNLYERSRCVALDVYKAIGCSGIARVDLLIDAKVGVVYFNELNPLPGSLYVHNWQRSGVSATELVQRLIGYAVERHDNTKHIEKTFSTNFLKQF